MKSVMTDVGRSLVLSYRTDKGKQKEIESAAFSWSSLFGRLYNSGAKLQVRKVVELIYCKTFDEEGKQENLKSNTYCSDQVRE